MYLEGNTGILLVFDNSCDVLPLFTVLQLLASSSFDSIPKSITAAVPLAICYYPLSIKLFRLVN